MQRVLLSTLLLLSLLSSAAECSESKEDADSEAEEDFTPEQLAKARAGLDQLYREKLDANKDGKVTRQELISWLAEAGRQQTERDLDEAWRAYNLTSDGADSFLDWETHAARKASSAASPAEDAKQQKQQQQAEFQAEVKRAIEEASKETGIDRAGIKVGVPQLPTAAESADTPDEADGQQQRLALELGRDRRRWEAADVDSDGRLSRREFSAFALAEGSEGGSAAASPQMRRVLALEALERMDSDGDGRVSLAEFLAGAPQSGAEPDSAAKEDAKNFKEAWDVNKDGHMDAEEMEKMLDYVDSAGPQGKEAEDEAEAAEMTEEADRLMKLADSDGDGSLSKAEVLASLREFAGSAATDYGGSVGIHDEL